MLPDSLRLLEGEAKVKHAAILAYAAQVDGEVVETEVSALEARMGGMLLPDEMRERVRILLKSQMSINDLLNGMDDKHLRLALRDTMLMVAVDGIYHEKELKLVEKIAKMAEIPQEELNTLFAWVDDGWNWMAEGRGLFGLPIPPEVE